MNIRLFHVFHRLFHISPWNGGEIRRFSPLSVLRIHKFFSFSGLQNPLSLAILISSPPVLRTCGRHFADLRSAFRARGVPPRASLQFAAAPAPAERLAGLRLLGGPRCCHAGVRKLCLRTCGRHFADLRSAFRGPAVGISRKLPPVARLGENGARCGPRCGHAGARKLRLPAIRPYRGTEAALACRAAMPKSGGEAAGSLSVPRVQKKFGIGFDHYSILEDKVP